MLVVVNCLMYIRFGHNFFNELYWTGQIFVWTGQRFVWTCHRKMSDLWSYFLRFSGWSFSIGELTPLALNVDHRITELLYFQHIVWGVRK